MLEAAHFEQICIYVAENNIDIISIQETWLNSSISDNLVAINGYKLFRSDRDVKKSKKKKGGGVCCYIRNNLKAILVEKSSKSKYTLIDFLLVEIISNKSKFFFGNFYRHADNPQYDTNEIFEHVSALSLNYNDVFMCGDFNANYFDAQKYSKLQTLTDTLTRINDMCPTYHVGQFTPSQIDIIFAKNPTNVIQFGHFPAIGVSNHEAIYAIFRISVVRKEKRQIEMRNFNKFDQEEVDSFANNTDWSLIERGEDIDTKVNVLCNYLHQFSNRIFPVKTIVSKNDPVPWMNEEINIKMKERKIFYDWQKMNRNHQSHKILYASYRKIDNEVKRLIKSSKKQCFDSKYKSAKNSKEKWKLIHNFGITKKSKKAFDTDINDVINPNSLNAEFNKLDTLPKVKMELQNTSSVFQFTHVNAELISKTIYNIKSNGTGPDQLPPICFKLLHNYISKPIANILNCSFDTGKFPDKLKSIAITPIPKVNDPQTLSHFRPISNANFLLKIFSTITCKQLNSYLEENKLLSEHQSGFRKNHSCTTAILKLTEEMHDIISRGKCMILILLDFSNAFGSVDHDRLIQVLESVGIKDNTLKWFKSFLIGWNQIVKQGKCVSDPLIIKRGIIQGENNSQLLFSIFINNIIKYVKVCKVIMFADDIQLYIECDVDKINEAIEKINQELQNILQFCHDFGMNINPKKSQALVISSKYNLNRLNYDELQKIYVNGDQIQFVDSTRDLGYHINRTGTYEDNYKVLMKKAYYALNTLQPLKKILSPEVKLQLVKSLVLPIIDYMDIIYHGFDVHGTINESNRIEKIQNYCIRYVKNIKKFDHITSHRNELKLLTLFDRRNLHTASMIFKIINEQAPRYLNSILDRNMNNTRSQNKLIIKKPKTNHHMTSLSVGGPKLWNQIPEEIRTANSVNSFCNRYKEYLIAKQNVVQSN